VSQCTDSWTSNSNTFKFYILFKFREIKLTCFTTFYFETVFHAVQQCNTWKLVTQKEFCNNSYYFSKLKLSLITKRMSAFVLLQLETHLVLLRRETWANKFLFCCGMTWNKGREDVAACLCWLCVRASQVSWGMKRGGTGKITYWMRSLIRIVGQGQKGERYLNN